jgi:hypothetical protein
MCLPLHVPGLLLESASTSSPPSLQHVLTREGGVERLAALVVPSRLNLLLILLLLSLPPASLLIALVHPSLLKLRRKLALSGTYCLIWHAFVLLFFEDHGCCMA